MHTLMMHTLHTATSDAAQCIHSISLGLMQLQQCPDVRCSLFDAVPQHGLFLQLTDKGISSTLYSTANFSVQGPVFDCLLPTRAQASPSDRPDHESPGGTTMLSSHPWPELQIGANAKDTQLKYCTQATHHMPNRIACTWTDESCEDRYESAV